MSKHIHSPFGLEWIIAKETGWTLQYIRWGVRWHQLQYMLADAPGMRKVTLEEAQKANELNFLQALSNT